MFQSFCECGSSRRLRKRPISSVLLRSSAHLECDALASFRACFVQRPVSGTLLSLYGEGLDGYSSVSLSDYTSSFLSLPSTVPLASGLDLLGTSAYRDTSLSPAPSCKPST